MDDEVLLINLQGSRNGSMPYIRIENVGVFETLRVMGDVSGTGVLTFASSKVNTYGDSAGNDTIDSVTNYPQVFVQRIPNYNSVHVAAGAVLTGKPWAKDAGGGVFFIRVKGTLTVEGTLHMDGRGYLGGGFSNVTGAGNAAGTQGQSRCGGVTGANGVDCLQGGGNGGIGCVNTNAVFSGGGGALGTAGAGSTSPLCPPMVASVPYGNLPQRLYLASGGGGGASSKHVPVAFGNKGGAGGGIVVVHAQSTVITGTVSANGSPGLNFLGPCDADCSFNAGAGGGGAGGSVLLYRVSAPQQANVHADGGLGGNACSACTGNGGQGGQGQIVFF